MKKLKSLIMSAIIVFGVACNQADQTAPDTSKKDDTSTGEDKSEAAITEASAALPLDKIKLPQGFRIEVFAEVDNARSLALGASGTVYAGNRNGDKVYAVRDT